jgi:polysaccharide chain length determinant protein (PEP-CTERM system associated)
MKDTLKQILSYLQAVYRYKYLFVAVSLLVMTAIGIYSLTLPKIYRADTTVFIESNVIDELVRGIAITPRLEDRVRVLQAAMLSRDMIVKTLVELNSSILTRSEAAQQAYISGLQQRTRINVTRQMDRFTVSIEDPDPQFAQRFINTLVGQYVEESLSSTRDETFGAGRFLQEQLDSFKIRLEEAEDRIIEFRRNQGIFFSVDEAGTLASIRQMMNQVEEIELNQDTLRARQGQLAAQLNRTSPTIDMVSEAAENNRLMEMENRLSNLLLRYTENYPEVVRLKFEMESLKQRMEDPETAQRERGGTRMTSLNPLHQQLQSQLYEVESELSSLEARKRNLQQNISAREQQLQEIPEAQKALTILIQERDSYRTIYNDLLSRMTKSEVSTQMEVANKASTFRVIDPAILPQAPVSPDMLRMLLLAVAGGFGCGLGLIFLLDNMDSRVRDVAILEELGLQVLAVVPNISDPAVLKRRYFSNVVLVGFSGFYLVAFIGMFLFSERIIPLVTSLMTG